MINGAMNYRKLLIAYRVVHLCRHVHLFRVHPVVHASSAASVSAYRRSRLPCPANGGWIEGVNQFSGRSGMKNVCQHQTRKAKQKVFLLTLRKTNFLLLYSPKKLKQ